MGCFTVIPRASFQSRQNIKMGKLITSSINSSKICHSIIAEKWSRMRWGGVLMDQLNYIILLQKNRIKYSSMLLLLLLLLYICKQYVFLARIGWIEICYQHVSQ